MIAQRTWKTRGEVKKNQKQVGDWEETEADTKGGGEGRQSNGIKNRK